MHFSTTAVVAFIVCISTGALASPLPPYGVQELVARSDGKGTSGNNKDIDKKIAYPSEQILLAPKKDQIIDPSQTLRGGSTSNNKKTPKKT